MLNTIRARFVHFGWPLVAVTAAIVMPASVFAQETPAPPGTANPPALPAETKQDATALDAVVVTGTSQARVAHDTPLAVTSFDEVELARFSSNSNADLLNLVPTIKAEGGGGEIAVNVFTQGLPSGGQYQFTPLMYDGIPVFSAFGLNSSSFDIFYRNDLGIERFEFVRGGVSNLFGPGSVAGLINYISTTGSDQPKAKLQLEVAEENRVRGDFAMSGPLDVGDGNYYALSGFYRYDEGPIRTGNESEGGQLRGNLKHAFEDDSGSITVYGQYIDDKAQFVTTVPLDGESFNRVVGNDGEEVYSVQTSQANGLSYMMPDGVFTTSIGDGVSIEGGALAVAFDKDLGDGWGINGKAKYADYDHLFGFWTDGDGVINQPETQTQFLENRNLPADAVFTYADTGEVMPADDLLWANRFIDRERTGNDITAELNATKEVTIGGFEHNFTVGGFFANAEATDNTITTTYLADLNNEPRLVDLVVTDATGAQTIISNNGLLDAGVSYTNTRHEATRYAIYFADQMESDRFIFDIGARVEKIVGDISRENTTTFVTDTTTPNLSQALRNVVYGNGTFLTAEVDTQEWALAGGVIFKLRDDLNLYANASRGYFFPELRAVQFDPLGQPQEYSAEILRQAELGLKYFGGRFSGTLAAFYNDLSDRRAVLFQNDGMGGITETTNIVSTRAKGIEATFKLRVLDHLSFEGNLTWQDHEFTAYDTNPLFIGNQLVRQPNILYNMGLFYDDGRFDASLFTTHTGDYYTADTNAIELEAYDLVRLGAGYRFGLGEHSARISFDVYNLFDDDAVTEGAALQLNQQTADAVYFIGRPVLPRRVTVRFTLDF